MLINTLAALIIVAAVKGQYVLMKQNQLELEYGHEQFVDSLNEGLIIVPKDKDDA